jgi:hypothetical protein
LIIVPFLYTCFVFLITPYRETEKCVWLQKSILTFSLIPLRLKSN